MDNATAEEFNAQPLEVRYNSAMDYGAKCELWDLDPDDPPDQQPFPLESTSMPDCWQFSRRSKVERLIGGGL